MNDTSDPIRAKTPEPGGIAELLGRLVDDAEAFVRAEIKLYRTEAIHKVNVYRPLLALAAVGGLLASGSITLLLMALVFVLAPHIGFAWSALIVAVLAMMLAGSLIGLVVTRIRKDLAGGEDAPS